VANKYIPGVPKLRTPLRCRIAAFHFRDFPWRLQPVPPSYFPPISPCPERGNLRGPTDRLAFVLDQAKPLSRLGPVSRVVGDSRQSPFTGLRTASSLLGCSFPRLGCATGGSPRFRPCPPNQPPLQKRRRAGATGDDCLRLKGGHDAINSWSRRGSISLKDLPELLKIIITLSP
jgi:hypothetical protein